MEEGGFIGGASGSATLGPPVGPDAFDILCHWRPLESVSQHLLATGDRSSNRLQNALNAEMHANRSLVSTPMANTE